MRDAIKDYFTVELMDQDGDASNRIDSEGEEGVVEA